MEFELKTMPDGKFRARRGLTVVFFCLFAGEMSTLLGMELKDIERMMFNVQSSAEYLHNHPEIELILTTSTPDFDNFQFLWALRCDKRQETSTSQTHRRCSSSRETRVSPEKKMEPLNDTTCHAFYVCPQVIP